MQNWHRFSAGKFTGAITGARETHTSVEITFRAKISSIIDLEIFNPNGQTNSTVNKLRKWWKFREQE